MKALAIVRSVISESVEEQRLRIAAYAQSENIDVVHLDIRVDDNFENILHSLKVVDVLIVTNLARITRNAETLNEFQKTLDQNNVKLIALLP
jgi:DNA invertase Pin-like site-specific DNA recombinase